MGEMNLEKMKYRITVIGSENEDIIECTVEENLLEAMTRQGIYISAACGSRGTCGKCSLRLLKGSIPVSEYDRKWFSEDELKEGYRLSCKAYPTSDCTIKLSSKGEDDFEVVADIVPAEGFQYKEGDSFVIAIDIGTTTIAVCLIETVSRRILSTYTSVNRQRAYGADVISRIEAACKGKLRELKACIQEDLLTGIRYVIRKTDIDKDKITKIAIAGNTTMGHLLLGYSCETLGSYPFTPVNIGTILLSFEQVMDSDYLKVPVVILPGISTFVGADITAGLLACGFDKSEKINLLIDLGTNGELAIGNRDKLFVSSTAAGPAFEGGNITFGVGSIGGAISSINIEEELHYRTIHDKAPVGICGTGAIEMLSELLKKGYIDKTGLYIKEYFENGFRIAEDPDGKDIILTQHDIREIQLAKAAVRAGIEILVKRFGIDYLDIDTIYLAGGFGYKLNIDKAVAVGLLPKEFSDKVRTVGNSSLLGAVKYLTESNAPERLEHLIQSAEEIKLSNDSDFNELFIAYMNFEQLL